MLDLGASIYVMPMHIFREQWLNNLQKTNVSIQLAYRSYVSPLGIVEDVLIKVGELIFLVDFYILDTIKTYTSRTPNVLLGRPFMKTTKVIIDADKGILYKEFGGDRISFNINDSMKYPMENFSPLILKNYLNFLKIKMK